MGSAGQVDEQLAAAPDAPAAPRRGRWEWTLAWVPVLLLYLVTRLFGPSRFWDLSTDQVTYLIAARTFPFHHLYNDQLYLIHSPAWGYVIALFGAVLRPFGVTLAWAGLAAAVGFVVGVFFVVRGYARHVRLGPVGTAVALLYVALSTLVFGTQCGISRFPILVTGVGLCLLLFDRWAGDAGRRRFPWALAGLTAVTLLTSDNALALFPCFGLMFVLTRGAWIKWRAAAGLLAIALIAAVAWPAVRLGVYAAHDDYPAGICGTVEVTRPVPWEGVLQPNLLPITAKHNAVMGTGVTGLHWKRLVDYPTRLALPAWAPGVWIIGALLAAAMVRGVRVRITPADVRAWAAPDEWRTTAKLAGASAILSLPMLSGLYPWYAAPYAVPFAVLLGRGADGLLAWHPVPRRAAVCGISLLCALLSWAWLAQAYMTKDLWAQPLPGREFIFARTPITPGQGLGPHLAELHLDPKADGVMMPVGRPESLTYAVGFRTICVPFDPATIRPIADKYGIAYVVTSVDHLRVPIGGPLARRYSGWDALHYVDTHPDEFPLVASPVVTYADGRNDTFHIYAIRPAADGPASPGSVAAPTIP